MGNQVDTRQPCSRTSTNEITRRFRTSQLRSFARNLESDCVSRSVAVEHVYAIFTNLYCSIRLARIQLRRSTPLWRAFLWSMMTLRCAACSPNTFSRKDCKSKWSTTASTVSNEHCQESTLLFCSTSCSRRSLGLNYCGGLEPSLTSLCCC